MKHQDDAAEPHPRPPFILRVGLTGGIACGKSTVAKHLDEQGATILDADVVAHALIEPGGAAYDTVAREFGPEIVRADRTIDRALLGRVVFADAARRARLEEILHPLIRAEEQAQIERLSAEAHHGRVAVINAALLFEAGSWRDYHRIVLVVCDPETQLERLMRRDGLGRDDALARIAAQMPVTEKLKLAHYVIDTSAGFEATSLRAREVFRHLQHDLVALAEAR